MIFEKDDIIWACEGDVTLAKIYPDFKRLSIIEAEIEDYVGYPGSDCLNGALIRYKNGNGAAVMENLCSHHSLILAGNQTVKLPAYKNAIKETRCTGVLVVLNPIQRVSLYYF